MKLDTHISSKNILFGTFSGIGMLTLLIGGLWYLHSVTDLSAANVSSPAQTGYQSDALTQIESILKDKKISADERIVQALKFIEEQESAASRALSQPAPDNASEPFSTDSFANDPFFNGFAFGSGTGGPNGLWDEYHRIWSQMDTLFDHSLSRMQTTPGSPGLSADLNWSPRGEFEEKEDRYVYRFDLPGVDQTKVDVSVKNNYLVIERSRESKVEKEEGNQYRREIQQGRFSRMIPLPADANADKINAELDNGVLTVTLQRSEKAAADPVRKIPVK